MQRNKRLRERSREPERQAHEQGRGVSRRDGFVVARSTFCAGALVGQQMTKARRASEQFASRGDLKALRHGFFCFLHKGSRTAQWSDAAGVRWSTNATA